MKEAKEYSLNADQDTIQEAAYEGFIAGYGYGDELEKQLTIANNSRNFNAQELRVANATIKAIKAVIENQGTTVIGKILTIQALIKNHER